MSRGSGSESLAWEITRLIAECDSLASCAPTLLELLTRYGHWRAAEVWLNERDNFELRHSWYPPEIGPITGYWSETPGGVVSELAARAVATGDLAWSMLSPDNEQRRTVMLRRSGITKILAIPLEGSERVQGALIFYSSHRRAPSASRIQHIRMFAASIGALLERFAADSKLRESEARTRSIVESAAAAIVSVDERGIVQFVNAAFEHLLGYSSAEIRGRNIECVVPVQHREQHGNYIRRYLEGDPSIIIGKGREVTGVRKDGSELALFVTVADLRLPGQRIFTAIVHDHAALRETIDALRRSRAFLADAQRLAHIGNWMWDIRSGRIEWSDEIFRIFDVDPRGFRPTIEKFIERVHPEDRDFVKAAIERAVAEGTRYSIDHRILRTDGTVAAVLEQGEVQFEDGVAARMIGTVQDMTQLRRANESLWKFYSAVEQTADEIVITDREGRIEYVNPAFEAATGYEFSEIAGKTPRVLKSGLQPKEYYEGLWATILSGEVFRGEFINRAKDGRLLYEEKTITPVHNEQGVVTHFVATGRDISERHRIARKQEELRLAIERSAREWRQTFDSISLPILLCDGDGVIRRMNRAAAEIIGSGSFSDRAITDLPREQPWIAAAELLFRTLDSGRPQTMQVREPVSARGWELATTVFPSRSAGEAKVILLANEVTSVIELQESLRRTEMMSALGTLVAGVAHEVRNPLFAISATIDAFEDRTLGPEEFAGFAARLRVEVNRLTNLMAELLEYGRPNKPELSSEVLRDALTEAVDSTRDLARESLVNVDLRCPDELGTLDADARGLYLLFRNLVDNAIRHAGAGGQVTVTASHEEGSIEVQVADSGPGFRAEDIPHLFDPFFTRRRNGTGLGLAVVQRVIEQHGGTVTLANRPEGGAIARVRLPLVTDAMLAVT